MPELQFQNSYATFQDAFDRGYQRGQRNRLQQLVQQAYNAPEEQRGGILAQIAGINLPTATGIENQYKARQQDAQTDLVNRARFLTNAPEHMRAGIYQQMLPDLQRMGVRDLPAQYDNSVAQAAQAILQSYGGQGNSQNNVAVAEGTAIVNPQTGKVVYERPYSMRPQPPIWDSKRGAFIQPPQFGGAQPNSLPPIYGLPPPTQQAQPSNTPSADPFASLVTQVPDLRVTSRMRTPEQNQQAGGVTNSYHLTGQALDVGTPNPQQQAAMTRWAAENGYEAIRNYKDGHWHLEPRGNAPHVGPTLPPQAGGYGPQSGPTVYRVPGIEPERNDVTTLSPSEATQFGFPAGAVVQRKPDGTLVTSYVPPKATAGGTNSAANDGLNDRQRVAVKSVQRNLIQYASALTGKKPEELSLMTSEQIAAAIRSNGGRFVQGGVARTLSELPFGGSMVAGANADIVSYAQGAGAAWAAYENPTGMITNTDRETATAQMPNPLDPPEVQATKIKSFLDLSGWNGGSRPAVGKPAAPARQVGPAPGAIDGGYRFRGGNPADPKNWEKL